MRSTLFAPTSPITVLCRRRWRVPSDEGIDPIPSSNGPLGQSDALCRRDVRGVTRRRSLVGVVDDSDSVRESLPDLLQESGFAVQAFASAEAFLTAEIIAETSCLVLDVGLPGM